MSDTQHATDPLAVDPAAVEIAARACFDNDRNDVGWAAVAESDRQLYLTDARVALAAALPLLRAAVADELREQAPAGSGGTGGRDG